MSNVIRARLKPRIYDFSYISCKSSIRTFSLLKRFYNKEIRILDVGCGQKVYQSLFKKAEYIGIDYDKNNKLADVICDAAHMPFKDGSFDLVICSEVLEHVYDIESTIKEIKRVCKKDGYIYISSPFMFPLHSYAHDFYRYTKLFYKKNFSECKIIVLKPSNYSLSTPFLVLNMALNQFNIPLLNPLYLLNNFLAIVMENISGLFMHILKHTKKSRQAKFVFESMPICFNIIIKKVT